jgi:uncharacterized membrane protein YsdA (DUF1294 family)
MYLLLYLVIVNAVTYFLYWRDKRASRQRDWRTPEAVLLFFGFIGGTIAGFVAQRVLRHKNRKTSFQFKFWSLTLVQLYLLIFPPSLLQPILHKLLSYMNT